MTAAEVEALLVLADRLGTSGGIVRRAVQELVLLGVLDRLEPDQRCRRCGHELEQPATGRRREFCSDSCRNRWWRETKRNESG